MKYLLFILLFPIIAFGQNRRMVVDNVSRKLVAIVDGDSTYSFQTPKGFTFVKSVDSVALKVTKSGGTMYAYAVEYAGYTVMPDGTKRYTYSVSGHGNIVGLWVDPVEGKFHLQRLNDQKTLAEDK